MSVRRAYSKILTRILITDIDDNGSVKLQLQEFRRKYFWSKKSWITVDGCSGEANVDNDHYEFEFIKFCINSWTESRPGIEIINNSKNYTGEMILEDNPFYTSETSSR